MFKKNLSQFVQNKCSYFFIFSLSHHFQIGKYDEKKKNKEDDKQKKKKKGRF